MTQNELQDISDLLNRLALVFEQFAELAEAQALQSYANYQRILLEEHLL